MPSAIISPELRLRARLREFLVDAILTREESLLVAKSARETRFSGSLLTIEAKDSTRVQFWVFNWLKGSGPTVRDI